MGLVGLSGEDFAEVMRGIGYKNEVRSVPVEKPVAEQTEAENPEAPSSEAEATGADAPAEAKPSEETAEASEKNVDADTSVEVSDDASSIKRRS